MKYISSAQLLSTWILGLFILGATVGTAKGEKCEYRNVCTVDDDCRINKKDSFLVCMQGSCDCQQSSVVFNKGLCQCQALESVHITGASAGEKRLPCTENAEHEDTFDKYQKLLGYYCRCKDGYHPNNERYCVNSAPKFTVTTLSVVFCAIILIFQKC